jgi:hypothetical protein
MLIAALAIGTAFAQHLSNEPLRPDRLRVDSTLVLVPVEVSDGIGRPVNGLEKQNFQVFDDDVEQKIATFAMEDDPIGVCLVELESTAHVAVKSGAE